MPRRFGVRLVGGKVNRKLRFTDGQDEVVFDAELMFTVLASKDDDVAVERDRSHFVT